jgi:hypothetical protein
MALRKTTKSTAAAPKVRAPASTETRAPRQAAPTGGDDSNRLLREAAWSRMFGRVESKNPFTR